MITKYFGIVLFLYKLQLSQESLRLRDLRPGQILIAFKLIPLHVNLNFLHEAINERP